MATSKTAALKKDNGKATTSVAVKKTTAGAIVSIKEQMAKDLAALEGKTAPPTGVAIRVTQDKMFVLPNGTKTAGPLKLVIVDFNSKNNYYPVAFDPKNITPPACFAIGDSPTTLVPSDNSPEKQAEACTGCPMNQFESAAVGKGKACGNHRILAVLPPDADADTPLWTLSVSSTALKGFDGYVAGIARQFQVPPYGVVTEVGFNPTQTYASLVFSDPEPNENLEIAYSRREEARKLLMVEPDVSGYEKQPAGRKPAPRRK